MARPDPALAQALRQLRTQRSLTQENLAHAAGVTMGTLARIETQMVNPTWTTVSQVAAALDVTMAQLGDRVDRIRQQS